MERKLKSSLGRIRVGLVEDDAPLRTIFSDWLKQAEGIEFVRAYPDAESAITQVDECPCDVMLVDINLPGMNGIECVGRLKVEKPAMQFIMVTVYEDTDKIFDALACGASGYLLKQTTRANLLAAIRDVVEGGSPMTSNIARKVVQSFQSRRSAESSESLLSPREQEILNLLSKGYLYKEIAIKLGIAEPTVNSFIRRIYEKLHVHSRTQAVAMYLKQKTAPESNR
jgi:DNA-binding NarL/FixJ family response regulator